MKRIVLSLLLCSVALLSLAQKKLYYCEVKGIEKELTSGLKIVFDFGEKASYNMWGDLSSKLKFVDEDGGENGAFPPTRDGCIHSLSMREKG